jgi:SH3-like domain-containing protein
MAQSSEDVFNHSGLSIPRFVSLRSNKVFVRTGPALRYPIKWVYTKEGLPVEVIQEFDTWRQVRDKDGDEGWIHSSLLSGKRSGIIDSELDVFLHKKYDPTSKKLARIEKGALVKIGECNLFWCQVEARGFSGWVERKSL